MKFYPHYFFRTLRIFYIKIATSEEGEGGGVCVLLVGIHPVEINRVGINRGEIDWVGIGRVGIDLEPSQKCARVQTLNELIIISLYPGHDFFSLYPGYGFLKFYLFLCILVKIFFSLHPGYHFFSFLCILVKI